MQQLEKVYAGKQQISLSTASLKEGTYFVLLTYGSTSSKIKMVVIH